MEERFDVLREDFQELSSIILRGRLLGLSGRFRLILFKNLMQDPRFRLILFKNLIQDPSSFIRRSCWK